MSEVVEFETGQACHECGRFGAYAFDGETLCADCYQQRGSCCAEREDDCHESNASVTAAQPMTQSIAVIPANPDEMLRLNPNCCYTACPRCSSMRRLREFQSRHPHDWRERLRGLPRLVRAAQGRD